MIRVFKANDTNFTSNGDKVIIPLYAVITKNLEEEYIELECPLKYADFLIQDNILVVDTLTGKKGYKIHNPTKSNTITVKGTLCYQEKPPQPTDRGAVISHGKNLQYCEIDENWDDVVTKIIPVGYNETRLPEGYLSVVSPYQKVYEKEIKFELSESLQVEIEKLEEDIGNNQSIETGLKNSVATLQAKYNSYDGAIASLEAEKTALQRRLTELGTSEPELKEKAVIEAQIPLITSDINSLSNEKTATLTTLNTTKDNLTQAQSELAVMQSNYNDKIITDLRTQAQSYLDINQYPRINYDLQAHLDGIIEVGDIVRVKHPKMRIDLLTRVISYQWNCLTEKFKEIEFGTLKPTLKGVVTEIKEDIQSNKETIKKTAKSVIKYRSEYKRDNEELVSKFMSEVYGESNGIYGLLQKNQSIFRQTAAEISGNVSRVNADLSTDIASISLKADQIALTVSQNFTSLDGKISSNTSKITQTASEIRSEVNQSVTSLDGRITSNTSLINQTASEIRSEVNSKFTNYSTTYQMNSAITQKADNITLTVNSKFTDYSTTTQMNTAITQKADSITSSVTTQINGVKQSISVVEQTANKISWLVKSGSSQSDFTLTDRAISLVTQQINLTAFVTFNSLSTAGQTTINGSNIVTGTIDGNKANFTNINASNIVTGTFDASKVNIIHLSANSIDTGKLDVDILYSGSYRVMSANGNNLTLGGSYYTWVNNITVAASTFTTSGDNTRLQSNYCAIGKAGGNIGFFGTSTTSKKTIYKLPSSATQSAMESKINELITILNGYGLLTAY